MNEASPYPPSVQALIEQFATLPGIGKRSAERMAYHVLASPRDNAMALAMAIRDVKTNIRACGLCFNVAENELCEICSNSARTRHTVCVVELPRDIIAIEKIAAYDGVYHVLQGHLSPANDIDPEKLRINELRARITNQQDSDNAINELILALNPTTEGDATASYIAQEFADLDIHITRLARGIASGTDLESTTPSSLHFAFKGRASVRA